MQIVIDRPPIPWQAPKLGKYGTFSPVSKEKQIRKAIVREQWTNDPITAPVHLDFHFYMPIPKSLSKRVKEGDCHNKRPDLTNLIKLAEDCLIGCVLKDDNQTCQITAQKVYSKNPRVVIDVNICALQ